MTNAMRPIHPGEILRDELEELDFSATAFAKKLKIPTNRVTSILNEQRSVTVDTALRLACFFGNTPEFWMNLQMVYDIKTSMHKSWKKIRKQIELHKAA